MKKEREKGRKVGWIFPIIGAALLVVIGNAILRQSVKQDREAMESQVITVKNSETAAGQEGTADVLVKGDGEQDVSDKTASDGLAGDETAEQGGNTGTAEKEWTMPSVKIILGDKSEEARPEELSGEEAAEIGVRYLEECFGIDCEDKEVELSLALWDNGKRGWHGDVYMGEKMIGGRGYRAPTTYYFHLDAVTGKPVHLSESQSIEEDKMSDQEQKELTEEWERYMNEPWINTYDFVRMVNGNIWRKPVATFIREHGLNEGKTINTVELQQYIIMGTGKALIHCVLNEMEGEREDLSCTIDIRTGEVTDFVNMTYLGYHYSEEKDNYLPAVK